jgi:hypothetical protein
MTSFRQSGTCLIGWQGAEPVAQIAWDVTDGGWYINFLTVEQPRLLAPLLARFRQIWRDAGEPRLTAAVADNNYRLAVFLGSVPRNNPQVEIRHG